MSGRRALTAARHSDARAADGRWGLAGAGGVVAFLRRADISPEADSCSTRKVLSDAACAHLDLRLAWHFGFNPEHRLHFVFRRKKPARTLNYCTITQILRSDPNPSSVRLETPHHRPADDRGRNQSVSGTTSATYAATPPSAAAAKSAGLASGGPPRVLQKSLPSSE